MSESPAPPEGISPADWQQTPAAVRALLLSLHAEAVLLRTHLPPLQAQVAALQAQVAALQARLGQHSGNSSHPPSADPPSAPKRAPRPPRGQRRGAQPGHPGHHRPLLPHEQVDQVVEYRPTGCPHCQTLLPADLPPHGTLQRRQVTDLPPIQPHITEYQFIHLTCPGCRAVVPPPLPADLPPGCFGPRLVSLCALLHSHYRLSARQICALLADLCGVDLALGSVPACWQTVSAALALSYAQVQAQVEQQPVANVDETGWNQAGVRHWLWVAVTALATLFLVSPKRNRASRQQLLGAAFAGVVGSDRFSAYGDLRLAQRQICWAHLLRQVVGLRDRGGGAEVWASVLLPVIGQVFHHWHRYQAGECRREELAAAVVPVQRALRAGLEAGQHLSDGAVQSWCAEVLRLWPALWTFVAVAGVEPTNNAAERALRPAVLWRKGCFGAASTAGNEFVARSLTVVATCRQQERHVWTFLAEAVRAYWAQSPPPALFSPT
jgi:transposase